MKNQYLNLFIGSITAITLMFAPRIFAQNTLPIFDLTVSKNQIAVGETVTAVVNLTAADGVAGYQVEVAYDPSVLELVSAANGNYFTTADTGIYINPPVKDNINHTVVFTAIYPDGSSSKAGIGSVGSIQFKAVGNGDSGLDLPLSFAISPQLEPVTSEVNIATLTVGTTPPTTSPTAPSNPTASPTAPTNPTASPTAPSNPTATPIPTATLSPTPSTPDTNATLRFLAQGINTSRSAINTKVNFNGYEKTITASSDANGVITANLEVPGGTGKLCIKPHAHLQKCFANITLNTSSATFDVSDINTHAADIAQVGDVNNDNIVDLSDFALVSSFYGKKYGTNSNSCGKATCPAPTTRPETDMNLDGWVNYEDMGLAKINNSTEDIVGDN